MAVIPAQVQQVRNSYEIPQDNPFLTMLNAGVQGYFARKNLPQQLLISAFPSLVATKQVRPAQPGEKTLLPNVPWTYNNTPDLDAMNTMSLIADRERGNDVNIKAGEFAAKALTEMFKERTNLQSLGGKQLPPIDEQAAINTFKNMYLQAINQGQVQGQEQVKAQGQYKIGQKIKKGNKEYTITGFDTDGTPFVK